LNAPPAVTFSAVIYALRCMVTEEIPLNQGCLAPITFNIPPGCLLAPSATAAVVGGNVLTSQRVTDVVLRAFGAAAASQGCMNNTTFGDATLGYYETVAGGAGAGPGWHGRSGVHTHMTNTRITDPEILERRYPVVLREFRRDAHARMLSAPIRIRSADVVPAQLAPGQRRRGRVPRRRWRRARDGGATLARAEHACGCLLLCLLTRLHARCSRAQFLRPLTVGILSERRALPPFGLAGGGDAARGVNLWLQAQPAADGAEAFRVVSLGGKATVTMQAGDRLRLLTPGGGGYGAAEGEGDGTAAAPPPPVLREGGGSLAAYAREQETA
jgi:5-oxoprolinase (ATP-hydrolysing)